MTREEEIKNYAYNNCVSDDIDDTSYSLIVETARWADETMICKARGWLQCIDFEVEYFTTDSDGYTFFNADKFIKDFCKKMEE